MESIEQDFPGSIGNYRVTRSEDGGGTTSVFGKLLQKARQLRDHISETCCACVDSIPSFALVIMAVVLIMLLIAAIPLAFALTYMNPETRVAVAPRASVHPIRNPGLWPKAGEIIRDTSTLYQSTSILPPKVNGCKGHGFSCTNNPDKVIGTFQRCDGKKDCDDGSDELDCRDCLTTFSCPSRASGGRQKKCLRGEALCNGISDCMDNSDEDETHCRQNCNDDEFKCESGDRCLRPEMRCDGDLHCPDGSDERGCTKCNNGAKLCAPEKTCIPKWKLCDGTADCSDGSDELDCDCTACSGDNKALCQANGPRGMCVSKSMVCDGKRDCPDGEDEVQCPGSCSANPNESIPSSHTAANESSAVTDLFKRNAGKTVKCGPKGQGELEWRVACDGSHPKCDSQCEECNPETAFTCTTKSESGPNCVHRSMVCDGNPDCADGSDEANCDCKAPGMTLCKGLDTLGRQRCYNEEQRCDGLRDCPGGEDERGCDSCKNGAFHCPKSKMCVPSSKRCDGEKDCPDLTDELNCTCEECSAHPFRMYMCSSGDRCFRMSEVCNPTSQCPASDEDEDKRDKLYCAARQGPHSYF